VSIPAEQHKQRNRNKLIEDTLGQWTPKGGDLGVFVAGSFVQDRFFVDELLLVFKIDLRMAESLHTDAFVASDSTDLHDFVVQRVFRTLLI